MQFTNLGFGVLLIALFISGAAIFWTSVQNNYAGAAAANPTLTNMTEQVNNMSFLTNQSTSEASQFQQQDNPLAAAFGYLLGAFNAIKTLFALPALFTTVLFGLGQSLGVFYPSFMGNFLIVAVAFVALLGILYYWLKVK